MIKDGQVRKLRRLLDAGDSLALAARKTGMDEKSARKYRDSEALPSQRVPLPRTWRTRPDPFDDVWDQVRARLEAEPKLRAFTLFGWIQEIYPGRFEEAQRRTFERRVRAWRAIHGPQQEVMFAQVHGPGDVAASDFTHMNELRITIAGRPFDHLLYHFTLTYSNWESVSICFSESFEAFSRGLQDAFWKLGGVPRKHRSDSLSAAVNNLSDDREFRARYRDLLEHYRVAPQRINVRQAHENGDVESSHGHLKTVIDQALLLRGSRDFVTREEYQAFLDTVIDKRNHARRARFEQERQVLAELPAGRLNYRTRIPGVRVHAGSTIRVKRNTYSVPSRLIGYQVDVVIDADFIEVWYGETSIQRMPRLVGTGKSAINYRHVIDSLVRKPGAFENYRYREEMFPTTHFRIAYDWLCQARGKQAGTREYLKILQLAARDSQDAVQDALRQALADNVHITAEAIRLALEKHHQIRPATDVNVEPPNLQEFDSLLHNPDMEVHSHDDESQTNPSFPNSPDQGSTECGPAGDRRTDRTVAGPAPADVPGEFFPPGGEGDARIEESRGVFGGVDGPGMPSSPGEPDRPPHAALAASDVEDLEQFRLESFAPAGCPANGESSRRFLSGSPRERPAVWETGFRKEPLPERARGAAGASWSFGFVYDVQFACPAALDCQAGSAFE